MPLFSFFLPVAVDDVPPALPLPLVDVRGSSSCLAPSCTSPGTTCACSASPCSARAFSALSFRAAAAAVRSTITRNETGKNQQCPSAPSTADRQAVEATNLPSSSGVRTRLVSEGPPGASRLREGTFFIW